MGYGDDKGLLARKQYTVTVQKEHTKYFSPEQHREDVLLGRFTGV